jgi:hypothetical protein
MREPTLQRRHKGEANVSGTYGGEHFMPGVCTRGTVAAIAEHYFRSQRFTSLPPAEQESYRLFITAFTAEHHDRCLADFGPKHIKHLLARQAALTSVVSANNWLRAIKALVLFGADWEMRSADGVASVRSLKLEKPARRSPPEPRKLELRKLYVIRGGSLFKIGTSYDPKARRAYLQTGSPLLLDIISAVEIETPDAEHVAHHILARLRSHGEWFDLGALGDYFAGRVKREASNINELLALLQDISGFVRNPKPGGKPDGNIVGCLTATSGLSNTPDNIGAS